VAHQVAQDHAWVEAELEASIALGRMHEVLGDVDGSLQYHEASLALASQHGWQVEVEASYRSLVSAYSAQADRQEAEGSVQQALEWLQKCLAAAESAADMQEIGVIHYRMGLLHHKAGAPQEALAYFNRWAHGQPVAPGQADICNDTALCANIW
jgi:tetratricopeptide (TPR) repeat protein